MTRKDYVIIARALAWARPVMGKASQYKPQQKQHRFRQWESTVASVADALGRDNPRFNIHKFMEACHG